jgi:16S rRNA (guanine527-N7)-methyltransferase
MDGISARAFAPLSKTLEIVAVWLKAGAVGVFPRGRTVAEQLEHACPDSNYTIDIVPSVVEPSASLLKVRIR